MKLLTSMMATTFALISTVTFVTNPGPGVAYGPVDSRVVREVPAPTQAPAPTPVPKAPKEK